MGETLSDADFASAVLRGKQSKDGPHATGAHYDAVRHRIVVELASGIEVSFSPSYAQGLEGAAAEDLADIEITPSGLGLHFPRIDADIHVPGLLEGLVGSAKWMAGQMGRAGGAARSEAKAQAARENGKRGGRPRKSAA